MFLAPFIMSGAFFCPAGLGLECFRAGSSVSFRNSAACIQGWIAGLKDDKRFIVSAAGKAEEAVRIIMGDLMAPIEGIECLLAKRNEISLNFTCQIHKAG